MEPLDVRLVAVICFLAVAAAIVAVWMLVSDLLRPKQTPVSGRLRLRTLPAHPETDEPVGPIQGLDASFERLVVESGLSLDPMTAALLLVAVGLLAGGLAFVWTENPIPAVVILCIAIGATLVLFSSLRRRRLQQIQEQLPDVVDAVARSVRAGGSLDQAVTDVAGNTSGPLGSELRRCARQLEMGLSLPAAFYGLERRIHLIDVQMLVTTLNVHRQTGGSLAVTLERLTGVMRDRLNYRRQVRATTAAGRLSALLIAAVGPLLFLYFFVFQADYIKIMLSDTLGQLLLASAVVLEAVGIIWILGLVRNQD
jgi:tight adherence protein B